MSLQAVQPISLCHCTIVTLDTTRRFNGCFAAMLPSTDVGAQEPEWQEEFLGNTLTYTSDPR